MALIELAKKLLDPLFNYVNQTIEKRVQHKTKEKEYHNKSDTITLKKIKKLLYESGVMEILKDHDFTGPYFEGFTSPIIEYLYEIEHNPEFIFLNTDLDKLKIQLDNNIKNFSTSLALNSFPLENKSNLIGVPKEWSYRQPERHKKVVSEINYYAMQIDRIYTDLIQVAKKNQIDF